VVRTFIGSILCAGLWAGAIAGYSPGAAAKPKIVYLELMSFSARTQGDDGMRYSPITTVLGIPGRKYFSYICRMLPRVRDAVVNYYNDYPIPIGQSGQMVHSRNQKRLLKRINTSLNGGYVWRVYTVTGARTGVTKPTKVLKFKIRQQCVNGLLKKAD